MNQFNPYSPWIQDLKHDVSCHIFCFPHAGGSASAYAKIANLLPEDIQLLPVQLPGRENRFSEPPSTSMDELIINIHNNLHKALSEPYILFGHSMGAKIVYEWLIKIYKSGSNLPLAIIISGCNPPHIRDTNIIHILNDNDFINELNKFSPHTAKLLQDNDFRSLFLPLLRADFTLDECYTPTILNSKFSIPIYAWSATNDKTALTSDVEQWKNYTKYIFKHDVFSGDHFFLLNDINRTASTLCKIARVCLSI